MTAKVCPGSVSKCTDGLEGERRHLPLNFVYIAQGTPSAEALAVQAVGEQARRATVYLNLEPGDCHGDDAAVKALLQGGICRAVIGTVS